jgi:hypothetical protein
MAVTATEDCDGHNSPNVAEPESQVPQLGTSEEIAHSAGSDKSEIELDNDSVDEDCVCVGHFFLCVAFISLSVLFRARSTRGSARDRILGKPNVVGFSG